MLNHIRQGEGEPVVLLHGLFGGSRYWKSLMAFLSDEFEVIALDLPGFARSADVSVPNNVSEYGSAVLTFLESLGLESFNILGHSLGGAIAQQMAIEYPNRIDRLVAYATKPALLDEDRFESFEKTMERVLTSDIDDVVRAQAANWLEAGTDTPNFALCLDASQGVTSKSAAACLQAIRGWDVRDRLYEVKIPVLIVSGDRDSSVSLETLIDEKQAFSNGQLSILPGCAHMAHLESPACFNLTVGEFLKDTNSNN
jgi:2-hydroxy-6-oxonona-2,4-dienedioate hydrolase